MTDNHQNCIAVINAQEDIALPALMEVEKALDRLEDIATSKREPRPCRALAFQALAFLYGVKEIFGLLNDRLMVGSAPHRHRRLRSLNVRSFISRQNTAFRKPFERRRGSRDRGEESELLAEYERYSV
jgi:hypothetical protein